MFGKRDVTYGYSGNAPKRVERGMEFGFLESNGCDICQNKAKIVISPTFVAPWYEDASLRHVCIGENVSSIAIIRVD